MTYRTSASAISEYSSASVHSRTPSGNSVYSLASPLVLSPTPSSTHSHKSSRSSLFAKLKAHTRSRHHDDDDGLEWKCKGEDLEENFNWPPSGWDATNKDIQSQLASQLAEDLPPITTPPLAHSRSESSSSTTSSSSSAQSSSHSIPTRATLNLSAKQTPVHERRQHARSRAPALFIPLPTQPLNIIKGLDSAGCPPTPDEARQAAQEAAVEAINDYFSSLQVDKSLTQEDEEQRRAARRAEADYATRALPPLPASSRPKSQPLPRPLPQRPNSRGRSTHSRPASICGSECLSSTQIGQLRSRRDSAYSFI